MYSHVRVTSSHEQRSGWIRRATLDDTLAAERTAAAAGGVVVIEWIVVFPAVPFLPIGQTAGPLGAMLMVLFRVIPPEETYDTINLPILGLLFGTMVVSVFLEKADMFKYHGKLLLRMPRLRGLQRPLHQRHLLRHAHRVHPQASVT